MWERFLEFENPIMKQSLIQMEQLKWEQTVT